MSQRSGKSSYSEIYRVRSGYLTSIAMLLVGAILALSLPIRAFEEGIHPLLKIASLAIFLVICGALMRVTRTSIRLREDCLEVVNPFSRKRLPWVDIDEIALGYPEGFLNDRCAVITTNDGVRHPVSAVSDRTYFGDSPDPTPASAIVEELNAALLDAKRAHGELDRAKITTDSPKRIWRMT